MAWRDSRRNRARLFLFIAAVTVGIAALTAVRSFSINLQKDIDREAKTLLGADLSIEARQPAPDSLLAHFKPPGTELARVVSFVTMVRFPKNEGTRLVQVRALEGNFPFYGKWKTEPDNAAAGLQQVSALAEHALMLQFNLAPGDSVQIGNIVLPIGRDLLSSTGRAGIASSIAPVVYIPLRLLDATELVQRGSRVDYQYFFKYPPSVEVRQLTEPRKKQMEAANLDWSTVESRKENIGAAFGNMGMFLNLTGFIALLLGCIGVAGAVHIYIRDKLPTVAILRCLGAAGKRAFYVYLVQVSGIGLLGAVAGAVLGSLIQKVMPLLLKDLLPLESVSTEFSPPAAAQGVLLGMTVAVLFALLPLSGILRTSPLRTLRASFDQEEGAENVGLRYGVYVLIAAAIFVFTWSLTRNVRWALAFMGGIAVAFVVLYLLARVLTFVLRHFFPKNWKYVWRQGIANLFRPQNQTVLLLVTIGLGTMLLSTLFLVRNMLLKQIEFAGANQQPNMVLFDIQTKDRDSVARLAHRYDLPVIQQVPIVTCRIETIEGRTKAQDEADSLHALPRWVWDREYRVTFRDTLIETEKVVAGTWTGSHTAGQVPIRVSVSDGLQKAAHLQPGSKLVFNVQGARLECEVGSVREVNFSRVQTNFLVVFPRGVLEAAPQFHVLVTRVPNAETSARFQSELVQRFPGISAIDLTQILKSVDEVLRKVSFVIRFMALFSILTGMLVLLSSIYQNKYARIRESVLLRTLGASRRQILQINSVEYLLLGALACLTGTALSVAGAWALARFAFQVPFRPDLLPLLAIFAVITLLTLVIGLLNSREVVSQPPLEVLRAESQ